MKQVTTYICRVDGYRRPSRRRNTAGVYRVGAKSEKQAVEILRDKIGFGDIKVIGVDDYDPAKDRSLFVPRNRKTPWDLARMTNRLPKMPYKTAMRVVSGELRPCVHATSQGALRAGQPDAATTAGTIITR